MLRFIINIIGSDVREGLNASFGKDNNMAIKCHGRMMFHCANNVQTQSRGVETLQHFA